LDDLIVGAYGEISAYNQIIQTITIDISVSSAGDVNGDGLDDWRLSSHYDHSPPHH
jgi:hypothetical protein